ncbi:MAG: GlsB/YeaQ/YmgE family stress response membrane protein [Bacteroidota bacterium]
MTGLIYTALVGILIGFLAGKLIKGRGFGLVGNLLVGVGGSIMGSLLPIWGSGLVGMLVKGVLGAVILLFIVGWFKKK